MLILNILRGQLGRAAVLSVIGAHKQSPLPLLSGVVHADLKLFLETNLPRSGKKKAVLGVSDSKVGAALQEEFGLSIQTSGVVAEIARGEGMCNMTFSRCDSRKRCLL